VNLPGDESEGDSEDEWADSASDLGSHSDIFQVLPLKIATWYHILFFVLFLKTVAKRIVRSSSRLAVFVQ
jgi:hypothetical protein